MTRRHVARLLRECQHFNIFNLFMHFNGLFMHFIFICGLHIYIFYLVFTVGYSRVGRDCLN